MKASSCLVVICGILVSSDFALGASFGFQKFIAIKKPADSETAASDDAIIPITDDLVKRAEERFVKMQESMIRDINNQENEESLVQNLQNKTTKQLKIIGEKLVQTEEKVVSLGTKDNATIAIYKIINIRPLSFSSANEAKKSDSNQTQIADQPPKKPEISDEPESESRKETFENSRSLSADESQQSLQNDEPAQSQPEQPTPNESQNDQPVQPQPDQPAQNESAPKRPMLAFMGPDGVPKPIRGIAIKVAPKSDGTAGKQKPEIPSKKMKKPLDPSSSPIHADTKSNVKSAAPIDTEGSHSQGEALVTNYWQPIAKDLSKDTLINDRISQQQASAGIVRIDPDAEFIDPKQHKGHIAQDTRTNFKYKSPGVDVDAEEVQSENYNSLDAAPAADLSRDILVNEHMANQLASGSIKADHDAEFIDPKQHQGHVAQRTRVNLKQAQPAGILSRFGADRDAEEIDNDERTTDQKSSGADLSRDILVNEHVASQVSSGLITTDPEAEFVSLDGPNKNTRNYYYTTNNQQQPAALDLSRDTSISAESFYEPQPPANVMMIEPYPEYANRRYRRPTQNSYLRSADRYQRTPQRDLSGDTAINDHISQQQSASGLVMIDPDAELINTDANHQNNVYYYYSYVPNNIDQVPRMKRTESIYQFYQRPVPVVRYPYPQQPVYY